MLMDAVTGYDPAHDSTSAPAPFEGSLRENLSPDMKGVRIGLPKEYFGAGNSMRGICSCPVAMEELGCLEMIMDGMQEKDDKVRSKDA